MTQLTPSGFAELENRIALGPSAYLSPSPQTRGDLEPDVEVRIDAISAATEPAPLPLKTVAFIIASLLVAVAILSAMVLSKEPVDCIIMSRNAT